MLISRKALVLAALLAAPAGLAVAQVPIGSLSSTVVQGQVGDIFGDRFILEDGTGRILVQAMAPLASGITLNAGETLVIVGTEGPNGFDATSITRADGTELLLDAPVPVAATPAPTGPAAPKPAGGPAGFAEGASPLAKGPGAPRGPAEPVAAMSEADAIAQLQSWGFTSVRLDDVEARHFEFEARDADGREIDIELAFDGTIRKFDVDDDARATTADLAALLPETVRTALSERQIVEVQEFEMSPREYKIEGYDAAGGEIAISIRNDDRIGSIAVEDGRAPAPAEVDEAAVLASVKAAGYDVKTVERGPRHLEVAAVNPEGENVTLHVDFNGEVYQEVLDRSGF